MPEAVAAQQAATALGSLQRTARAVLGCCGLVTMQ